MSDEKKSNEPLFVDTVHNRLIQQGRICLVVWGKDYRKLVCIVDFIDRNRVLVDGGNGKLSNIARVALPMRWLQVTKFRLNIERAASSIQVSEIAEESNVINEYNKSAMGRRNVCIKKKQALNDFGRFKLHFIKGQFKKAVSRELMQLRADQKKIDVKELMKKESIKKSTHPVLRRVVGKFRRKLESRIRKKQMVRETKIKKTNDLF
eukprot:UN01996